MRVSGSRVSSSPSGILTNRPRTKRKRERFLTDAEFTRPRQVFGEVSGNGSRAYSGAMTTILLSTLTGCRRNEILTLVRSEATPERPHGLAYSLTLHDPDDTRLVGFDNAHPVRERRGPGTRRREARDHRHRLRTIRPYEYKVAATLLEDFWREVDEVLRERGSLP